MPENRDDKFSEFKFNCGISFIFSKSCFKFSDKVWK